MGQDQSSQHPLKPLSYIVDLLKQDGPPKKIAVLTGAGVSTSAGIPDFRSPGTGLYANLARLNLPHPEAVFELDFFRTNPAPFYALAKELAPGKYLPTVSHAFIALLHEKGLLQMLFTQNIDCLDRAAGIPDDKIVEAHGSFATQRCIDCKTPFSEALMATAIATATPPHCEVPQCNGLVKPDIVFFGEGLPEKFFANIDLLAAADLLIVMGTSLAVAPFAHLPMQVAPTCPRLLFNRERVGNFGAQENDVVVLDDCDAGVRELAALLGWADELEALFLEVGGKVRKDEAARLKEARQAISADELLEEEIAKVTAAVDRTLQISKEHGEKVTAQFVGEDGTDEPADEKDQKEVEDPTMPQHKPVA